MIPFNGLVSISPVRKQLMKLLDLSPHEFDLIWDKQLTLLTKKIQIDIPALDDILHERFGSYEDDNLSMHDVVEARYGKQASDYVTLLISK